MAWFDFDVVLTVCYTACWFHARLIQEMEQALDARPPGGGGLSGPGTIKDMAQQRAAGLFGSAFLRSKYGATAKSCLRLVVITCVSHYTVSRKTNGRQSDDL